VNHLIHWATLFGTFSSWTGCKSERSEGAASAPAGPIAAASTAVASAALSATAPAGKCPAGRWKYDYSDQALEVMLQNAAGARVLKEEGEFICTVSEGKDGSISCDSLGKPVVNVIEAKQAGIPMTISVTMKGKASNKFRLDSESRMTVIATDTSQLEVKTSVNVGGKEVPFPTDKFLTFFGEAESTLSYKCEGGALYIKPEIDNVQTTWQKLEPVP
jgi:hypothetical protein